MRLRWVAGAISVLAAALFFIGSGPAHAEDVTVTIGVGDTILTVSGKTSPGAFVTIIKDGAVIGTAIADSNGIYSQTFPAQEPGLHQLSLYAHTVAGDNTDTVTVMVSIAEHATTTVSLFLPSTLLIMDSTLTYGQQLELHGETVPFGIVGIYINNSVYETATADAEGKWHVRLDTTALPSGQHDLFVRVVDSFGEQSYPTVVRHFTLEAAPISPTSPVPSSPVRIPPRTVPGSGTIINGRPPVARPPAASQEPLVIQVPQPLYTVYQRERVAARALAINGRLPYGATIRWGDGTTETRMHLQDELLFSHAYENVGRYAVTADIEDAQGRKAQIYFTVDVKLAESNVFPIILLFIVCTIVLGYVLSMRQRHRRLKDQNNAVPSR